MKAGYSCTCAFDGMEAADILEAVSYTHLDVYKRQGVYSARYMGEDTSYDIKNNNLIERLDGVPKEKRTCLLYTSRCV